MQSLQAAARQLNSVLMGQQQSRRNILEESQCRIREVEATAAAEGKQASVVAKERMVLEANAHEAFQHVERRFVLEIRMQNVGFASRKRLQQTNR